MEENKTNFDLPETIKVETGNISILNYGLVAGLIGIVISAIMYVGGVDLWFNAILGFSWYIAIFVVGIYCALQIKKLNDGHIFFSTALKYIFGVAVIGILIVTISHYVIMNFVDTEFAELVSIRLTETYEETWRKFGMSEAEIERQMEKVEKYNNYKLQNVLLGYGQSLIGAFIVSLIAAAIIKKNKYKHLGL